jgi:hypothetical protein
VTCDAGMEEGERREFWMTATEEISGGRERSSEWKKIPSTMNEERWAEKKMKKNNPHADYDEGREREQ